MKKPPKGYGRVTLRALTRRADKISRTVAALEKRQGHRLTTHQKLVMRGDFV